MLWKIARLVWSVKVWKRCDGIDSRFYKEMALFTVLAVVMQLKRRAKRSAGTGILLVGSSAEDAKDCLNAMQLEPSKAHG